jgi:phosphoglycerate dehydrogenase-like enzyme
VKDYHASRWERDEYSLSIDVQALTMDALEEVLRDADIRSYIFPISKEQKKILEKAAERNE